MIYVASDLHGCSLQRLRTMLEKIGFTQDDDLYLLGDILDRTGDGGIELLRWTMTQPNITLLMGNHEAMLLGLEFFLQEVTEEQIGELTMEKITLLNNYYRNGGDITMKTLRKLAKTDRTALGDIFDYLRECPLYDTVSAGEEDFLLVHAGLGNFKKGKRIQEYTVDELIWEHPGLEDEYFEEIRTVFGHTPTFTFGETYSGKILKTKTWIDVDVGAMYGYGLAILRLDDLQEFYEQDNHA